MNRLIILDNLRHGSVRLLVIGVLYAGIIAPAAAIIADEPLTNVLFFYLGFGSVAFGLWITLGGSPVRNELQLDALLLIPRTELITTLWFLRTLYPAAWITLFFGIASLLGLTQAIESVLPAHLLLHLFAALACGFSVLFLCSNLRVQYSGGKWRSNVGVINFIAMLVPSIYLALLSGIRDNTTAASVFIVFALFVVVATQRIVCSRLLAPMFRRPSPDSGSNTKLLAYLSKFGGFRQLALYMIKSSVLFFATFFLILAIMWWFLGVPNPFSQTRQSTVVFIPLSCFLFISNLHLEVSPNNLNSRVLRTLPLTAGNLALRIIAVRCAGLTVGLLCLTPLFFWIYGEQMGLFLVNVSILCIASSSIMTPFMLWIPNFWGKNLFGVACAGMIAVGLMFADQGLTEGSLTPLAIAYMVSALVLFGAWRFLRALLCRSSRIYRSKAPEEFSA